ncbi:MAG: serine O-acetyltransferase [Actinomycetota bacterium]
MADAPDTPRRRRAARRAFVRQRARRHPAFLRAVAADARCALASRGMPARDLGRLALANEIWHLAVESDAFLALICYRAKARLQAFRVPLLPAILHRFAIMIGQVSIGDPVLIAPGIYLPHGQVVIDGLVEIGESTAIRPWVTIGLAEGVLRGPTIGGGVRIGTGAKVIGPVTIGNGARIGANAVVLIDVPSGSTAVGVPARVIPPE